MMWRDQSCILSKQVLLFHFSGQGGTKRLFRAFHARAAGTGVLMGLPAFDHSTQYTAQWNRCLTCTQRGEAASTSSRRPTFTGRKG